MKKKILTTTLEVLLFLLILESAFAIHEYGHLREFQKRGVPVKEFSLGIGPKLCSYQTDSSLTVSFRLVPIMAYVAPTEKEGNLFKKEGRLWDKIAVDAAGVRNNFLVGLAVVFLLQVLGWKRGNISAKQLARTAIVTPFKIPLRFVAFLVGCVTWGRINLAEKFLLSTGGIDPPKLLKSLIFWNLTLGLLNLAPIPPLDGGHAIEAILAETNIYIPEIPRFVGVILFAAFYATTGNQDMRILEIEKKSDSESMEFRKRAKKRRSDGALSRWEEEGENAFCSLLEAEVSIFISTRVSNLLKEALGIYTIGELREATASQLLNIKGFGPKALTEIEFFLRQRNLSLKPEI